MAWNGIMYVYHPSWDVARRRRCMYVISAALEAVESPRATLAGFCPTGLGRLASLGWALLPRGWLSHGASAGDGSIRIGTWVGGFHFPIWRAIHMRLQNALYGRYASATCSFYISLQNTYTIYFRYIRCTPYMHVSHNGNTPIAFSSSNLLSNPTNDFP